MNLFRILLAALPAAFAHAQVETAQDITRVTLEQSIVPLYGPWRFTVDDSPIDPAANGFRGGPCLSQSKKQTSTNRQHQHS